MEFVTDNREPKKHLSGVALVVLLHAGLLYGVLHGLQNGQFKLPTVPPVLKFLPPTPDTPVEPVVKLNPLPKQIKQPDLTQMQEPKIREEAKSTPTQNVSTAKPTTEIKQTQTREAEGDPPVSKPVTGTGPVTASVACSNYLEIRDALADKLPLVAERMDFAGRGISQFEMVAQLTVGPGGEISNPSIKQNSNAYASRAMESSVLSSLRKLKCDSQNQTRAVQVPLTFSLVN